MSLSAEQLQQITSNPIYQFVKSEDLETVVNALDDAIESVNDQFIDNFRVFPSIMMFDYEKAKDEGCCGFYDSEVTAPSGTKYLIGFNYGH